MEEFSLSRMYLDYYDFEVNHIDPFCSIWRFVHFERKHSFRSGPPLEVRLLKSCGPIVYPHLTVPREVWFEILVQL